MAIGPRHFSCQLSAFSFFPIFPAQPEKERGKERDEPTVAVLLIRRPLQAQVATEYEPEKRERGEKEQDSREPGARSKE